MELAATKKNGATVYVDYAHTPDAIEVALKSLKPHILGKLIVIIGAGGERDEGKASPDGDGGRTKRRFCNYNGR